MDESRQPQVLLELGLGSGIIDRWGVQYENIIEEVDFTDIKQQYVEDVDSSGDTF